MALSVGKEAEMILDAVALGAFAVGLDKTIIALNRAGEELTGLSREEAVGRPCCEVFRSTLCDSACPVGRAMSSREKQLCLETVFIRQGGRSVLPVRVSASPLIGEAGRVIGAVEVFQGPDTTKLLEQSGQKAFTWESFIGASRQVDKLFEVLKIVAPTDSTILIEGQTGTGKDLLARIIHHQSPRAGAGFIKVNCAALPENLLESELFGYVRGAFTGADRDKPGRFNLADKGTIFLDEISEMPLSLQAKLLRVIEDREFYPLGGRETTKVDVRIIAATNKPLREQVAAGEFREDLFYRLNVIRAHIPPLAERPEDIPLLINRYLQRKNMDQGTVACRFSTEALNVLMQHAYPGNVRELENILEHACLLCGGDRIGVEHLPAYFHQAEAGLDQTAEAGPNLDEKRRLIAALTQHGWNRSRTAESLGMDRTTLWRKMKRLGIKPPA